MDLCSVGSYTNGYPSLYDQVLSWSIADIFDENLFKDKVKQIPLTFRSTSEYFDAFVFPFLEEVRAELCSSMEMISRAPFAALVSCHLSGLYTGTRLFDIKVDYWRSGVSGGSHGLSRISSGDVVILLKSKPQTAYELQSVGQNCVLGHVVDILEDDTGGCTTSTSFTMRASGERDLIRNYANGFSFVCFLVNLRKYERMWNKLHMRGNLMIINKVLQRYPVIEDGECYCLKTKDDGLGAKFDACLSSSLNPCQKEVVVASLRDTQCDHKASILCVSGPPGTGKTKTISTLLYILLERNCRTLMCAATNVAISVVLSHVLSLLKESRERGLNEGFSLANIVLVESGKPFGTALDCETVSLDFRVKQLAECLDPQSGWRACFGSLLDFLNKCRSQYKDSVKKGARNIGHRITVRSALRYGPFLRSVRDQFKATSPRVRRCVSIFCTHLPQSFLLKQNIYHMQLLMAQIDSFGSLLLRDNFKFKQLRKLSSQAKGIQSLLTKLQDSLGELPLPDVAKEDSIVAFCLRLATLVMCEAHCSFQLYAAEMQPLSVLVIDEGLQLTECESIVALQVPGLKHAILFGDEYQLPATVKSNLSSSVGYGRSLFQRLGLLNWPKHVLNIQYRMHPAISSFPNSEFYLNQIVDAPNVRSRGCEKQYLPGKLFGAYSFINISQSREEIDDEGQIRNLVEVAVLMKILQNLYREWHCSSQKLSVCVTSPYPAQVMEIERRLVQRYQNCCNFAVKVKTIEGFQGSEADVVIISAVRSSVARSMQSISDFQRVNVALTRARHCLWVLGNEKALVKADPVWKALISNAKERSCLFDADEDLNIAQIIINVKTELDQLVDLLNKDSFIFKCTRWKVIFSGRFVKSFLTLPSTWCKKFALSFLVRLANGWRPKKYKSEPSCQSSLKIARQFKVVGYYVICTNDIAIEKGYASQVFKVWDILHLEDVPELVRKLDDIYGAYTDEFLIRCKEKCLEGSLEVPRCYQSFNISRYKCANEKLGNIVDAVDAGTSYAENSKVKDSLLLMKFYSLSAGLVNHLLSSSDGRALDLPFEVTDEEREVILHKNTTFVLGRSGTGKTTVLATKLFQNEQLHHMASEGLCPVTDVSTNSSLCKEAYASGNLHQLFVTVNPRLCFSVKQHVSNLRRFVSGEFAEGWTHADLKYIDENEEFKDIPNSFHDISASSLPLIMTFRIFLLMLDATVGASFFDRYQEIRDTYSLDTSSPRILSLKNLVTRKEVTYDRFRMSYWPHFDSTLTRGLDSSRVFTEINSCIKGRHIDDHKLPRESYIQLSHKRVSNFCEKEREMIYNIFECYEKMKMVRGEFDLADLVNDLHRRLKLESYEGQSMDFVYIDEVQDLTMKQIALFKYICKNVEDGFVFAGDTAQTIARGVDFRFEDIRGLFYREFLHRAETNGKHRVQDKGKMSPLFHLSQNFRTHLGVLNLAQSIVDLIYHFFPSSIDILNSESSLLNGEAPILLDCGSKGDVMKIFDNQGYSSENAINFGSEQVILVRDDCARNEISDHIRGQALVLTIFECKGLEFQDVLLYNFFGSSSLNNEWRVIYEYMEKNMVGFTTPASSPSFNPARHNVLCFELKQLYVAITRTRQRLWICERDGLLSPMFDYWRKLNVVQVRELESSFVKAMQVSSTVEDWRERGLRMLQVQNYRAAEMCFERAGDCQWKYFARAAGLRVSAENMRSSRLEKSVKLFREAADLYESINNIKEAAQCYFGAEDYEKAGNLFYRESDLYKAAECFNFSGCPERAAQVYAEGGFFCACLNTCYEGELFDLGLCYVRSWKQKANFGMFAWKGKDLCTTEQEFLKKCATASHKQRNMEAMMKYVKDFTSLQLMRIFLKKLGCSAELLALEVEFGNLLEAAKIARQNGDILREGDLLGQAGHWQDASILYFAFALASRLWADGNNGWPTKEFPSEEDILLKAKAAAHNCSPLFYEILCTNIQLLTNADCEFSKLKRQLAFSQRHNNLRGEILCARRVLDSLLKTADASMHGRVKDEMPIKKLAYYWNLWKDHVLSIFKYLDSQKGQTIAQCVHYGEFCFEYLGVRKQSDGPNSSCSMLYADAQWVQYVPGRTSKTDSISMYQLLAAARRHWCTELVQVGMDFLNTLKSLYDLAIHSSMPTRGILVQLFEAVAFLRTESRFLNHRSDILLSLQSYIELLEEAYFLHTFCLCWTLPSEETILQSESCRSLLKEVILKKIMLSVVDEGVSGELTSSHVMQVVVILLGASSTFNEPFKETISESKNDSPWQLLLKDLVKRPESEAPNAIESRKPEESRLNVSHVRNLHGALADLCKSWREEHDCISPCCFVYLLDRLLVLVSRFKGHLFATRSSVIEWFMHLDWKVDSRIFTIGAGESSSIVGPTYDFLARTVHQLLLMSHHHTKEWIKNARLDGENSFQVLILRLTVLMCVICLNSGKYLDLLSDVINRSEIISELPSPFVRILVEREGCSLLNVLAEALHKINDPLVIVRGKFTPTLYARSAIFLNVFDRSTQYKGSIIGKLFRNCSPGKLMF